MSSTPAADQSYLGRVFDSYQNMMQVRRCLLEVSRRRRLSSLRVLELARRATGLSDYMPEAQIVRHATHRDNQPLLKPPVSIPFEDRSFDACLVTDAYEHVPAETRPGLLSEMIRVTHGLVLLGCPQGNEIVPRLDRLVFDFIWGKYGERFEPLDQHIRFGLEPVEQTLASFRALGVRAVPLPCNYVYRWIHQILLYFDLQHRQPHSSLYEDVNRTYNRYLSPYDYREPCYRYLILVATDPELDIDALARTLQGPTEVPEAVTRAEGAMIESFRAATGRVGDQLRISEAERAELYQDRERLRRDIERLEREVDEARRGLPRRPTLRARLKELFGHSR